jgi:hypothetical protein
MSLTLLAHLWLALALTFASLTHPPPTMTRCSKKALTRRWCHALLGLPSLKDHETTIFVHQKFPSLGYPVPAAQNDLRGI